MKRYCTQIIRHKFKSKLMSTILISPMFKHVKTLSDKFKMKCFTVRVRISPPISS